MASCYFFTNTVFCKSYGKIRINVKLAVCLCHKINSMIRFFTSKFFFKNIALSVFFFIFEYHTHDKLSTEWTKSLEFLFYHILGNCLPMPCTIIDIFPLFLYVWRQFRYVISWHNSHLIAKSTDRFA